MGIPPGIQKIIFILLLFSLTGCFVPIGLDFQEAPLPEEGQEEEQPQEPVEGEEDIVEEGAAGPPVSDETFFRYSVLTEMSAVRFNTPHPFKQMTEQFSTGQGDVIILSQSCIHLPFRTRPQITTNIDWINNCGRFIRFGA